MTKRQIERIRKLIRFLSGINKRNFNLRTFFSGNLDGLYDIADGRHDCGSTACVIGWCPIVFPRSWTFACFGRHIPNLKKSPDLDQYHQFSEFFGINLDTTYTICHPMDAAKYGGMSLAATIKKLEACLP